MTKSQKSDWLVERDKRSFPQVPESRLPPRKLCAVCGFPSSYTCVTCGARYCSLKCLEVHQETRCLKWTV